MLMRVTTKDRLHSGTRRSSEIIFDAVSKLQNFGKVNAKTAQGSEKPPRARTKYRVLWKHGSRPTTRATRNKKIDIRTWKMVNRQSTMENVNVKWQAANVKVYSAKWQMAQKSDKLERQRQETLSHTPRAGGPPNLFFCLLANCGELI